MIDILSNVPLFSKLTDEHLMSISQMCVMKTYEAGTVLFREKDIGKTFYVVVNGNVKIYTSNTAGEEKILNVFSKGEAFGELSLLDGLPRSATAEVVDFAKLLSLSSEDFIAILKQNFGITLSIMNELSRRLRETNQQVHDLTFLNKKQRIVKSLIKLALKNGTRQGHLITIHIQLNYDEIAQMAGVDKKDIYEVFQELHAKQILELKGNEYQLNLSKM